MQFSELNKAEQQSIIIAAGVVLFSILSVLAYIFTSAGALFYALAIVAFALFFYMAYFLAHEGSALKAGSQVKKKNAKAGR